MQKLLSPDRSAVSDWLMTGGMAQGLLFGSGRPSFWIGLPDNKDVLLFTSPSSRHFSAGQEVSLSRRQLLYNYLQPHTIAAKFANATHTKHVSGNKADISTKRST